MTHDPLCPYSPEQIGVGGIGAPVPNMPLIPARPCACGLIARVRQDEYAIGYGVGSIHGYSAALRDAVNAITSTPSADVAMGRLLDQPARIMWMSHAVAAIEALGGER